MDSHTLIQALIYLGAAALIVPIAVRLGLGSVLGYLIAGCIIGPWALRLVTDAEAILHFAEIGVVLMLFVIGLELDPQRLWKLRASVFWRRRAADGGLRGVDRPVLHAAGPALAGGRADWYDSGAFLNRDRYAGDE
ncbi:glutathione-regulated potassium-efflux system protein KefC [Klebsiella pneumoniae]|uniref:Glutathione-regulated potassium-efflux system protein KefC n=1 Tax=Klebsiella pneumoniae TaxID=573 RepID=A0A377UWR1_KLEPN|nr:glutathione-regulated potassium-efflux system protein KefC [Klebsiella pneumoniae]